MYGREDKATVTGRISDLSIALSGGSNRSKLHFPINRFRAGRSGWGDASRNTATFAVSREHRAGQPLPRKIMPDDEYYTNPAGLFGWFHGVPVGLPFTCNEK